MTSHRPQSSRTRRFFRRRSLRWRLPLLFGVLVLLVIVPFLWAMQRHVEATLVDAGEQRARVAADQIASIIERSIRGQVARTAELAARQRVREPLRQPAAARSPAAFDAVAADLSGRRRIEIWDAAGNLVLRLDGPRPLEPSSAAPAAEPDDPPPVAAGVSPLRGDNGVQTFDVVAEVRDGDAPDSRLLGYVRVYGRLTAAEVAQLGALVGATASVRIESAHAAPTPDTRSMVEATATIPDVPWVVHAGFPRAEIVAPAVEFMRRMSLLALLLVTAGVGLVMLLGARLTRPMQELAIAAEEIAAGDYGRRVHTERHDELGRLSVAFNTMTDRIEEVLGALQESHDQTQFALAAACIGIWKVHLDTGTMTCSETMRLAHGQKETPLPRTPAEFLELVHSDDRDVVAELLEGQWSDGESLDVHYRVVGPDGTTQWVEGKGRVQQDARGRALSVLGVSLNVSDRRRLESQFLQAQKMEAVGQLAGGVAHDFNNLLTSILGHGNLMLGDLPADDPMREDVVEILRSGESGARLTRQLLAFSRRQVTQHEMVSIDAVVQSTEKLLRRLIGEHIRLVTRLAPDLDAVRADRGQIEQVLVNLAVNARDAMTEGGTLTIATANVDLGANYAREHVGVAVGRYVMLSVTDTGIGMDTQTQEHVFEPFFTTKPSDKGTGLGLATVFGIVKQAGGHIYLYSEPGRGTTFKIYLPAAGRPVAPTTPRERDEITGGNETILIVEDNEPVRRVARTILERLGYRVLEAENGADALAVTESNGGFQPDLVLSDVIMPGMTGPELGRQLAERFPGIRVLFTSGYSGEALGQRGLDDPGILFIEKPYSPIALARKVREVLGPPEAAGGAPAATGRSPSATGERPSGADS